MPEARATHPSAQQLSDYGLGKLPDGQLQAVAAHLEACPECRGKVEGQPPDSFVDRLRDAAPGGTLPPRPSPSLSGSGSVPPQRQPAPAPAGVPAALAGSSKFEVLGKLGQGGMGSVYKARRTLLRDVVAVKVMSPDVVGVADARHRFVREMQAVAQLRHKHIVQAFDAEEVGGQLLLVMECVEGVSLEQLVAQKGPLPVAFACRCIAQAAEGLQHAHERKMVHRDIKPGNLMVTAKEKEVKILDFGLARAPTEQAQQNRTQMQTFMGTPEYVAPEQATDARSADIRADVYSLGCTLYFLLAGRPPFRKDTPLNTILAHLQEEPPPLAEVRAGLPAGLGDVVAKMLAKRPDDRYQTPAEVARALAPFAAGGRPGDSGAVPRAAPAEARSVTPRPAAPFEALDDAPEVIAKPASGARRRPAPAAGGGGKKWLVYAGAAAAGLLGVVLAAVVVLRMRTVEGTVEVTIDQADAEVFLDGGKIDVRVRGDKEPIAIRVKEGRHELKVTKGGFETWTKEFTYRKGDKTPLKVRLVPEPVVVEAERTVVLEVDRPGAKVYLDGRGVDVAVPGEMKPVRVPVSEGEHELKVTKPGFEDFTHTFTVTKGKPPPTVPVRMVRLPPPEPPAGGGALFNGKDLTGWEFSPEYWSYKGGELVGEVGFKKAPNFRTFLSNKKKYKDFELSFKVKISGKAGNSGVQIRSGVANPKTGGVPGPQCDIADGQWGRLASPDGKGRGGTMREASAEAQKAVKKGDFNDYLIRCVGKKVTIKVNGVTAVDEEFATLPEEGILAFEVFRQTKVTFKDFRFEELSAPGLPEGFVSLFDGKTLKGWKVHPEGTGKWKVEKGVLVGSGPASHLFSDRGDYKNFHFLVKARINDKGNSGQYFRAEFGPGRLKGHEAQIEANGRDRVKTGSLYGFEEATVTEAPHKPGEWFTQEVIAVDNHIVIKVNGKVTVDAKITDTARLYTQGHFALQQHSPGSVVEFRTVAVKELPDSVRWFKAYVPPHWKGKWRVEGTELVQESLEKDVNIGFGDPQWDDYDYSVEAKRVAGDDQFALVFRGVPGDGYLYQLGGWGKGADARAVVESAKGGKIASPHPAARTFKDWPAFMGGMEGDRWYKALVRVRGDKGECFLDGEKAFDFKADHHAKGLVGLRTWGAGYRFRNLKVTAPDGKVLLEGVPEINHERLPPSTAEVDDPRPPTPPPPPPEEKEVRCIKGFGRPVNHLAFVLGKDLLLTSEQGGKGSKMDIWSTAKDTKKPQVSFEKHHEGARGLAVAPNGRAAVSYGWSRAGKPEFHFWAVDAPAKFRPLPPAPNRHQIKFLPGNKRVVLLNQLSESLRVVDLETGKEVRNIRAADAPEREPGNAVATDVSRDGKWVVVAERGGPIRVWDAVKGEGRAHLKPGHPGGARNAAFHPDGKHVLTAGEDGTVRVWDWEEGKEVARLEAHKKPVVSLAFAPDGKRVLSGGEDGLIVLWDAVTWKEVCRYGRHDGAVLCLAVSPNGRLAASGGDDKTVRLWQLPK